MAKLVLTISADNKATQSVKLLHAEVQTLSKTLSSIKVNTDLTKQINALSKYYTNLAKAAVRVNEATTKRQIAEQKLANEVKRGRTEEQRTLKVKAERERKELQLKQAQDKATQSTQKQTSATKANTIVNNNNTQSIGSMTVNIFKWQIAMSSVMKPLRLLKDAVASLGETLVKTEDSVIAIQRVLGENIADNEISSRLYKIAQDYGQTFENVQQIATNFARTGMSWADTIKATEAAVLALNVAELDATEASDGLISILTQFKKETSDLTVVVDKLNKAADNNPVTTEKLLKALQRTGAAAQQANINLDETIGIITTLSKATNRSGENLGTAVNSLIQFSSKASSLDTFAKFGGSVETAVEKFRAGKGSILQIWEELGKVINDRKAEGLLGGIFSDEEWAGLNEELKDALGEAYADLTNIYDTASTFRKNYFIALLNDMDNVKKVTGEIADANGYSQAENQKYLDTYTAKLNSVQAKWQEIANDEQGLLGIKKDLLDMGSFVLDIIQGVGGLKTALIALGVVVGTIALSFKGEIIIATLTKIGTLLKSLTIDAIPNAIGAWKAYAKGITTVGTTIQGTLPLITAIIIAISAIDSAIRRSIEKREEAERKRIEQQNEAIAKVNESIEAQKKEVAQMNEVAASVEDLRKVLEDSSKSEEEKAKAQDKLIQIQNSLIESNNAYKDSLDLANGSLKEQLGLIEQLTTEQLKQKANDFLTSNDAEIKIAQSRLDSTSTTNTDMLFSGVAEDRHKFRSLLNSILLNAGIDDVASINEDNEYGYFHRWGNKIKQGWDDGGLFGAIGQFFAGSIATDKKYWTGEANAGFSFSGTIEQQIDAIETLRDYIAKNKDSLGLSNEETVAITNELDNLLGQLNSEEYQQAQLLAEKAKATQDWLDGTITEAEYLKIVYGIEKEISKEIGEQTNDISKVTGAYDDLIKKLEELRDLNKEAYDWEEKKLAVLEAEQALENARNEATVRRFNKETGQWEWQTDEKAIKEAEENLEKARLNLEQDAYNRIIEQFKENTATNESILELIDEYLPFLGEDFANAVKSAIQDKTGVDIDEPINEQTESASPSGGSSPEGTNRSPDLESTKSGIKILDGASGKGIDADRYGDNGSVKWNGKTYRIENGGVLDDNNIISQAAIGEGGLGLADRTIFAYNGQLYGYLDGKIVKLQARKNSYGDKSKSGYKALSDAVTNEFGSYDSGGIANGLGYMPKATAQPETVNDPELTAKILSPVSNAQFDKYVRDMGIMFETARQYSQAPVIERVGGSTDNRVDNSGQINFAGGLTVGADRRGSSIDELLTLANIIPNT